MSPTSEILTIRPLVIGAGGLVGQALTERLEARFPHTVSASRAELDISDRWRTEAEIERLEPTVVINCAAWADVDGCEREPERAERLNAAAPGHLARICDTAGVRLIHLSTDYVFDGGRVEGEYDEADVPGPVNVYGRSKLAGEMAVLGALVDAVVLRVSFVFGPGRPTFIDRVLDAARQGVPLPAIAGWISRPTHTGEIAQAIEEILLSDVQGVWHLACPQPVSRYDFACEVFRLAGADPALVQRVAPESLALPAVRPARTPLSTARFSARFGRLVRPWRSWAAAYVADAARSRS